MGIWMFFVSIIQYVQVMIVTELTHPEQRYQKYHSSLVSWEVSHTLTVLLC